MDKEQVSAAPADREALNLDERCRIALECLPDAQYREMLARLLSDLRAAAPAAVPLQPLTIFKQALLAYADEEYCRSLRMFRADPCLGWEAKVKNGKYGPAEHNAHKEANEHMGAHRGIYAAVKLAESMLALPASPQEAPPAEPAPAPAMVMLTPVLDEVSRATRKFPTWPTDPLHAVAVLGEEFGELTKAMLQLTYEPHKTSADEVRTEAIQTAAMALRLVMSLDAYQYVRCPQHEQNGATAVEGDQHG
jgi:hypothetical protein